MGFKLFADVADSFCRGENWTHADSEHKPEECIAWQKGVCDFATFLDKQRLATEDELNRFWKAIYGARAAHE